MSVHRSILKSAGIVSIATLCSRILGFIRDIVIARLFGIYIYAQAFVVAFKIPNLLRDLVGEGATNAALVPVFSEYLAKHPRKEFWELANIVLNFLLIIVSGLTILGVIFAPFIVRIIAPGFLEDPEKLTATVNLTRAIFPYIFLVSLAAYAMALLNSLKHFSVPAFAPCLLNISIIVFAVFFGEEIKGLALGVLVGGLLQLFIQIPVLYKKGFRLDLFRRFRHPAVKLIGRIMVPRLISSCIYQLNNLVDTIFGSLAWIVGQGGVAALYFAYRLILFPLGIFSTALAQVILPTFSLQALEPNRENLKKTLSFGLRATMFVMLPASVGFMILAQPIISTIFQGGRFDAYSVDVTAQVLIFYSIGLFAYGSTRILQSCFFALKDTATPAKVAFIALILNIFLNAILIFPLKMAGIALATSLSGINTFLFLFVILKKKLDPLPLKEIIFTFLRILISALAMGIICFLISKNIFLSGEKTIFKFLNLGIIICISLAAYLFFCWIFRVQELRALLALSLKPFAKR